MRPTLEEIARIAQVSVATVSRFYRDKRSVSLESRSKIERALEDLGFSSEVLKKRKRRTMIVALLVPDVENPFFSSLVKNAEFLLSRLSYFLLLCNTSGDAYLEEKYLDLLEKHHVDGVILIPSGRSDETFLERVNKASIPIVVLDREVKNLKVPMILCDSEKGGRMATEYLLRLGKENIAFISGRKEVSTASGRLLGYRKALQESGIAFREELVFEGDFTFKGGARAAQSILSSEIKIDAIFAANDLMALGAMEVLKRRGIKIPSEVSIIGYDDIWLSRIYEPALTTVRQPVFGMCELAVNMLLRSIRGEKHVLPQKTILEPELVVRESCIQFSKRR